MIDAFGPIVAWALFYVSIASLALFAFGNRSKAADNLADEMADRLLHGDIRGADALRSSFHDLGDSE